MNFLPEKIPTDLNPHIHYREGSRKNMKNNVHTKYVNISY